MRWLALVLALLIVALQYPMWLGKGGWLSVRDLTRSVAKEKETNAKLKARNDALDADVRDLKTGFEAVEERARAELGMVRQDEVFFQVEAPPGRTDGGGESERKNASASASLPEGRAAPPAATR